MVEPVGLAVEVTNVGGQSVVAPPLLAMTEVVVVFQAYEEWAQLVVDVEVE